MNSPSAHRAFVQRCVHFTTFPNVCTSSYSSPWLICPFIPWYLSFLMISHIVYLPNIHPLSVNCLPKAITYLSWLGCLSMSVTHFDLDFSPIPQCKFSPTQPSKLKNVDEQRFSRHATHFLGSIPKCCYLGVGLYLVCARHPALALDQMAQLILLILW